MSKYFELKRLSWGDDLDGLTLEKAKDYIDGLIATFNSDAKLVIEYEWEGVNFLIEVEREATLEEKEADRIKKEKKEKADRVKFDKLKAEYGW